MSAVRNDQRMRPWTTGAPARPRYGALAVTPGRCEISVIGRVAGIPGSLPGTFTNASLTLAARR